MASMQENTTQPEGKTAVTANDSTRHGEPRRVLGELSTNAQWTPKANSIFKTYKPMTAQPSKRRFGSTIDDSGLIYLKRRRLSDGIVALSTERSDSKDSEDVGVMHIPHGDTIANTSDHGSDADRESSTERQSFSSLINYDPSSQAMPSSQARASAMPPYSIVELPISQAEKLRLRLKVAMYKVRTKQTTVSFEYLREDTASGSRESSKAVHDAVQQLRAEALARLALPSKRPLLPHVELTPAHTPTVSPFKQHIRDRLLASTPHHDPSVKLDPAADLTSSAVKGQVVEGLLGLKHGFER